MSELTVTVPGPLRLHRRQLLSDFGTMSIRCLRSSLRQLDSLITAVVLPVC